MLARVEVSKKIWTWAIRRSQLPKATLLTEIPLLSRWIRGEVHPTVRQLEEFARKTRTPLGYLFLDAPPEEDLGLPDFRTKSAKRPAFSPDLIETVEDMLRRQQWMRADRINDGHDPLPFVNSATIKQTPEILANEIRRELRLNFEWTSQYKSWEKTLLAMRKAIGDIGILVFCASMVRTNTSRMLNPDEFRGFVLIDEYAPVIFVNTNDSPSAQMFTLAHELVHVWVGQSSLVNLSGLQPHRDKVEQFCNAVAAEFLVPTMPFRDRWMLMSTTTARHIEAMSTLFRVSPLVIARRALDLELISQAAFTQFYAREQARWQKIKENRDGAPVFYQVQDLRLGNQFGWSVVRATKEGRLLYREAYELTGLKRLSFDKYSQRLTERISNERY